MHHVARVLRVAKGQTRVPEVTAAFTAGDLPLTKADQLVRLETVEGRALDQWLVLRGGLRLEQFWIDWITEYLQAHDRETTR